MDLSGLVHIDLGLGALDVDFRSRDGDTGPVVYLIIRGSQTVRLSIGTHSAAQARALAAGALAMARLFEELSE